MTQQATPLNGEWVTVPAQDPEAEPETPPLIADLSQSDTNFSGQAYFVPGEPDQPEPSETFTPVRFYKFFQHEPAVIDQDMQSITLTTDPATGYTLTAPDFLAAFPYEIDYVDLSTMGVITVDDFESIPLEGVQITKYSPFPEQNLSFIFTGNVTAEIWQTTEEGGEEFFADAEGPSAQYAVRVTQDYNIGRDALKEAVNARSN